MVKHIVMYKLKDSSLENAQALKDKFISMKGKIEVLKEIDAGVDVLKSARSFDVVLTCVSTVWKIWRFTKITRYIFPLWNTSKASWKYLTA